MTFADHVPSPTTPNQRRVDHAQDAETADRYSRQSRFAPIGLAGQERLGQARVLLIGCGALGGTVADLLVRAGIGHLTIVDRDFVELSNLQRQTLFDEADVAAHLPKAEAAAARLRAVNSDVAIAAVVTDVNPSTIEGLVQPADLVVDGTDNFETRYMLNEAAVKHGVPWCYGGVIGAHGTTMTIRPGTTPCLRCVFPTPPAVGSAPTCDMAGVIGPAVAMIAAMQASEAMKLALGADAALNPGLVAMDIWSLTMQRVEIGGPDPECPVCGTRTFSSLDGTSLPPTSVLCGSNAVQVRVPAGTTIDLEALGRRLAGMGEVLANPYLVRLREAGSGRELTIFPDGRAIIKGTNDPAEARVLYSRFVGT